MVRRAALAIATYLCNGDEGTVVGEPLFEYVTEGRQSKQDELLLKRLVKYAYSACGDLVHVVLVFLGVRDEKLINRDMDGGEHPWVIGANLTKLQTHPAWNHFDGRSIEEGGCWPNVGDPYMVCCDYHVAILEDLDFELGVVTSLEYGLFNKSKGKAEGKRNTRKLFMEGTACMLQTDNHKRHIVGFLSLDQLDLSVSAIVPDTFDEGVPDLTNPEPYILMP